MALAPLHLSFSYLTLQETPGIQGILCPWRKKEGDSEWGSEGVGCRRKDNAKGSTLFGFNKSPLPTLSTHTHTSQAPPGSRKGWTWGQWGSVELKERRGKERKCTPLPTPLPPAPFQCLVGCHHVPSPVFPTGREEEKHCSSQTSPPFSVFDFGIRSHAVVVFYCYPHLFCLIASYLTFSLYYVFCFLWINSSSLLLYICSFGCDSFWMKLYHRLRFSHLISQVWPHLA